MTKAIDRVPPRPSKCLGFPRDVDCHNPPGTPTTPWWCTECDARRVRHIDQRFEEMVQRRAEFARAKT